MILCKLLLDEEASEMGQLPGASHTKHTELDECPAHYSRIRGFGLISKLCFTFLQEGLVSKGSSLENALVSHSLESLFPSNVRQSGIQILYLLHDVRDLALVLTLNLAGLANGDVQAQLDAAHGTSAGQPAASWIVRGRETDLVLARIGRRESKSARIGTRLPYDAMIRVKCLVDGDEDVEVRIRAEGVRRRRPRVCRIVTYFEDQYKK